MQFYFMLSANEIVNIILPLTKEDNNCGFKKAKKLKARNEMILLINDYKEGKAVVLPEDVLKMVQKSDT